MNDFWDPYSTAKFDAMYDSSDSKSVEYVTQQTEGYIARRMNHRPTKQGRDSLIYHTSNPWGTKSYDEYREHMQRSFPEMLKFLDMFFEEAFDVRKMKIREDGWIKRLIDHNPWLGD
jgi:hypothetical protein